MAIANENSVVGIEYEVRTKGRSRLSSLQARDILFRVSRMHLSVWKKARAETFWSKRPMHTAK